MKTFEQFTQEPEGIQLMKYLNIKTDKIYFQLDNEYEYDDNEYITYDMNYFDESSDSWLIKDFNRSNLITFFKEEVKEWKEDLDDDFPEFEDGYKKCKSILDILQNIDEEEYILFLDSEELGLL